MLRRLALCLNLCLTLCLAVLPWSLFAQQLPSEMVTATKDDWEEINFEYKSALISDGFPSLLTLADLLKKNPNYKVKIVGHTDMAEGNDKRLALCRAQSVAKFLIKYGARENQISVEGVGNVQPKIPGQMGVAAGGPRGGDKPLTGPAVPGGSGNSGGTGEAVMRGSEVTGVPGGGAVRQTGTGRGRFYQTDVPRWMARRAEVFVTDDKGNKVGQHDGSVKDAIAGLQKAPGSGMSQDCCNDILTRLDRLEKLLGDKMNDLDRKLADLDKGRGQQAQQVAEVKRAVDDLPTRPQVTEQIDTVRKAIPEEIAKAQPKRISPIGVNLGSDDRGRITGSARGQLFTAFNDKTALQMQGEYMYWRDRQEGQFDMGLVNRLGNVQVGGFGSLKYVNFRQFDNGGLLGQASVMADYLFPIGRLGLYGTKSFINNAVIASRPTVINAGNLVNGLVGSTVPVGGRVLSNSLTETYLNVADTYGGSGSMKLIGRSFLEANLGFSRLRNNETVAGGMGRVVLPLNDKFAFTVEGGVNETLISNRFNSSRLAFGFQMGNFLFPNMFRGFAGPTPMDVPRVRYELLTRTIRTGNSAPIADAGGDQIGVTAGTITLNGTGSYDPDGDALTYEWTQVAGPSVPITGANTATATFPAAQGQTYGFRLQVKDALGLTALARAMVTTQNPQAPTITRFAASPSNIRSGANSVLTWAVRGATQVNIEGIGAVNNEGGSVTVSPTRTTTYRLVARSGSGLESVETVTVTVESPAVEITDFRATPTTIVLGETSQLAWTTRNARDVTISGIGPVRPTGSVVIEPRETTTYTLVATGENGTVERSSVVVVVTPRMDRPRIVTFAANPVSILEGESSRLTWNVEGADTVVISTIGNVGLTGESPVAPLTTTTYLLTATNRQGVSTSQVTVNVRIPDVRLEACVADPAIIQRVGDASTLRWRASNASQVIVAGAGPALIGGGFVVRPLGDTTYRIVATGRNGSEATCSVTVRLASQAAPPVAVIAGPPIILSAVRTVRLDGSGSTPANGLSYAWRNVGARTGSIATPGASATEVTLNGPAGDFQFELTVTDASGQSARALVTIRYTPPNDPLP
jgi:hypothetical protein